MRKICYELQDLLQTNVANQEGGSRNICYIVTPPQDTRPSQDPTTTGTAPSSSTPSGTASSGTAPSSAAPSSSTPSGTASPGTASSSSTPPNNDAAADVKETDAKEPDVEEISPAELDEIESELAKVEKSLQLLADDDVDPAAALSWMSTNES